LVIFSFWASFSEKTVLQKLLSVVEVPPIFGHVVVKYTVIVDVLLFNGFTKA